VTNTSQGFDVVREDIEENGMKKLGWQLVQ